MSLILLAFAFVCFVISIFRVGQPDWNKLVSAGLAFIVAAQLLTAFVK